MISSPIQRYVNRTTFPFTMTILQLYKQIKAIVILHSNNSGTTESKDHNPEMSDKSSLQSGLLVFTRAMPSPFPLISYFYQAKS